MYLNGIGTATPLTRYTKADCWQAFQRSDWFHRLDPRARALAGAVLQRDNGIEARWLALDSLEDVFQIDPDTLRQRFIAAAPKLAAEAGARALAQAQLTAEDIDAVVISTCTGYLCPGLSSYVTENLALKPRVRTFDLVGQGCAAALPNMQLAYALLAAGECRHVLSACVEISSAAIYLDNDPGVLVSACLFGDGAGAAVLSTKCTHGGRTICWKDTESLIAPRDRGALMFEQRQGLLRNILTRAVPQMAADRAYEVLAAVLRRTGISASEISAWIMHAGGRDVLKSMERSLGLEEVKLRYSAAVLKEYGNLSSAFIYFVLQAALADNAPSGWWWLCSFGAGFSCHGALLEVG